LGLAAVLLSLIYGITVGKYNYRGNQTTHFLSRSAWRFWWVYYYHISDVHSGSFDNRENQLCHRFNKWAKFRYDFTGDINTHATEMVPWIETLKKSKTIPLKISVLGNHDYGEYVTWPSEAHKAQNFKDIKTYMVKSTFNC
jgi:predicted MPP superfamily phosphohydrolase